MMLNLYMLVIGCRPPGRLTEQHDVFFGITAKPSDLIPSMKQFWPEAKGKLHVDAFRKVSQVNGYNIRVKKRTERLPSGFALFFINLGGYKPGELEEYHYKVLVVAKDKSEAIKQSKQTAFYKHYGFKGAESHIDDKYGVDVDDIHSIEDILPEYLRDEYMLEITPGEGEEDELHIGYFKLEKL